MLWINVVEWMARLVFLFLMILSIWSISILIERKKFYKNLNYNKNKFKKLLVENKFLESNSEENDLINQMLKSVTKFKTTEKIEKGFDVFILEIRPDLERGLPILGTLGSTTPFIGLLGTILGIIVSFGALSSGKGDMNAVMFSLAEALILTALGLLVAIPAVVGFNYFSRKAKNVLSDLSAMKDLFIAERP
jgi:biopolymer transport protein ExbB/TolQ